MSDIHDMYSEVGTFLQANFSENGFFCCVYGSYPAGRQTSTSDIDLFVAVPDSLDDNFELLKDFIVSVHRNKGIHQDEEVPYENKLLVAYADVSAAVNLLPFVTVDGFRIPPIEKTDSFLSSASVRHRLILNALTTPHDCIAGDLLTYLKFRSKAEESIYSLANSLCDLENPRIQELIRVLQYDAFGNTGEWFLGYKDCETVNAYLRFILSRHHD